MKAATADQAQRWARAVLHFNPGDTYADVPTVAIARWILTQPPIQQQAT